LQRGGLVAKQPELQKKIQKNTIKIQQKKNAKTSTEEGTLFA